MNKVIIDTSKYYELVVSYPDLKSIKISEGLGLDCTWHQLNLEEKIIFESRMLRFISRPPHDEIVPMFNRVYPGEQFIPHMWKLRLRSEAKASIGENVKHEVA